MAFPSAPMNPWETPWPQHFLAASLSSTPFACIWHHVWTTLYRGIKENPLRFCQACLTFGCKETLWSTGMQLSIAHRKREAGLLQIFHLLLPQAPRQQRKPLLECKQSNYWNHTVHHSNTDIPLQAWQLFKATFNLKWAHEPLGGWKFEYWNVPFPETDILFPSISGI